MRVTAGVMILVIDLQSCCARLWQWSLEKLQRRNSWRRSDCRKTPVLCFYGDSSTLRSWWRLSFRTTEGSHARLDNFLFWQPSSTSLSPTPCRSLFSPTAYLINLMQLFMTMRRYDEYSERIIACTLTSCILINGLEKVVWGWETRLKA